MKTALEAETDFDAEVIHSRSALIQELSPCTIDVLIPLTMCNILERALLYLMN